MLRFILINKAQLSKSWVVPDGTNVVLDDERTSGQYEILAIPKYADRVIEMLSFDFRPRHKWIEHILTAVLAIIIDQEKTLKIDGPEDFEKHMLLNVVSRLVCRAIRAENMPLDMSDVVKITESVYEKAAERFHSSVTFTYKFKGVKRELEKLKLIPDSLWCEIRDECIVLPIRGEYHAIVQDDEDDGTISHERVHLIRASEI